MHAGSHLWAALGVPEHVRNSQSNLLAAAMKELGFRKPNEDGKLRFGGTMHRAWVRGDAPFNTIIIEPPAERWMKPEARVDTDERIAMADKLRAEQRKSFEQTQQSRKREG